MSLVLCMCMCDMCSSVEYLGVNVWYKYGVCAVIEWCVCSLCFMCCMCGYCVMKM